MPRAGYRKDPHHRRVHHVSSYLNADEQALFVAQIKRSGLTKAAYVRAALTGVTPRARHGAVRRELIREMNRVGVNLNQLVKRANAGTLNARLAGELEQTMLELRRVLGEVVRG
jgi:hypothetical protein